MYLTLSVGILKNGLSGKYAVTWALGVSSYSCSGDVSVGSLDGISSTSIVEEKSSFEAIGELLLFLIFGITPCQSYNEKEYKQNL